MMKIAILITVLLTGCANNPLVTMNPYRMANYYPQGESPNVSTSSTYTSTPRALNITTNSGQVLVVPNYSTGAPMAVIRSGR